MATLIAGQRELFHVIGEAFSRYQPAVQAARADFEGVLAAIESTRAQSRQEARQEYEYARDQLSMHIRKALFSTKGIKDEKRKTASEKAGEAFVNELISKARTDRTKSAMNVSDIATIRQEMSKIMTAGIPKPNNLYRAIMWILSFVAAIGIMGSVALFTEEGRAIGGLSCGIAIISFLLAVLALKIYEAPFTQRRNEELVQRFLRLDSLYQKWLELVELEAQNQRASAEKLYHQAIARAEDEFKAVVQHLRPEIEKHIAWAEEAAPSCQAAIWQTWSPGMLMPGSTRFGTLSYPGVPHHVPALLAFPGGKPLLWKVSIAAREAVIGCTHSIILRLLAAIPPGKLRFTFVDPVGLGQNVAPFMALADYDEQLVTARAWSDPRHIEQRLAELTEHIETGIQKYLRHEYATIEDYNEKAAKSLNRIASWWSLTFPPTLPRRRPADW